MSTPDATADEIANHVKCLEVSRNQWIQMATSHMSYIRELADERDALEQRVERLRLAWDDLAWAAAESTRGRFTDADEAAALHLHPGDLVDKTEAPI